MISKKTRYRIRNLPNLVRGYWRVFLASLKRIVSPVLPVDGNMHFVGKLSARVIRGSGETLDLGLISIGVVTTAGVNALVDAFQGLFTLSNFKYHASGTGTTAEATTDTVLVAEVGSRVVGTQTEGSSANIYKTVGTITYASSYAITEHGLFSASTGGTLWDRSVFSAINVSANDSIEFTYELTCNAGG